jgi:formate--tetrahydrofolate ligase
MLEAPPAVERPAPRPIAEVVASLGVDEERVRRYGRRAAKLDLALLDELADRPDGKLVCVTAMTPTKRGEGKTTTAISLVDGLWEVGTTAIACLREPSVGPLFGIKGGGTGAGRAQLVPGDDINLHFTGDLHAVGAANNLLAAIVDSHLLHDNPLGVDPSSITVRRCVDVDDRALRRIAVGLGESAPGYPRETGFDITAASEVMAILSVARDLHDLRRRLGAITVARTFDGAPITAENLHAAGAMAVVLRDAIEPNLVQTLEGRPALVHCGPFANIAHGNSSLVADRLGLKLADLVVTETGFGSDMGFVKFADIVCRLGGFAPAAAVVVATVQALKHHGGDPDGGLETLKRGTVNLDAHLRIVRTFGLDPVVAINRHPEDTAAEIDAARTVAAELGAEVAVANGFAGGGGGSAALAELVADASTRPSRFRPLYGLDESLEAKLEAVGRLFGADTVTYSPEAAKTLERLRREPVPVCVAKTHLSLSPDPALLGAPSGFELPISELRPYTGAGWVVAVCGKTMTMPGLPAHPAAEHVDLDALGFPAFGGKPALG